MFFSYSDICSFDSQNGKGLISSIFLKKTGSVAKSKFSKAFKHITLASKSPKELRRWFKCFAKQRWIVEVASVINSWLFLHFNNLIRGGALKFDTEVIIDMTHQVLPIAETEIMDLL